MRQVLDALEGRRLKEIVVGSGPGAYGDVYKRQVLLRMNIVLFSRHGNADFVFPAVAAEFRGVAPVAYTHLDVYKRQSNACLAQSVIKNNSYGCG